jgi:hypothetical protein
VSRFLILKVLELISISSQSGPVKGRTIQEATPALRKRNKTKKKRKKMKIMRSRLR